MADVLIWTGSRFAAPLSGFDTDYRYLRQTTGGALTVSAGRTWRLGAYQVSGGQPWVAFRFDVGVPTAAVNVVTVVVSGTTYNSSCAAVGPTSTGSVSLS